MRVMVSVVVGVLALMVIPLPAHAQETFSATLTGAQEIPPVDTPNSGTGSFILNAAQDSLYFDISWTGLTGEFTGAHFHNAPPDSAGPVVFSLVPFVVGNTAVGVWPIPPEMVTELLDGDIYVNIHSTTYPAGEIRGQLLQDEDECVTDSVTFSPDDISAAQCLQLCEDTTAVSRVCVGPVGIEGFPIITIAVGCGEGTNCAGDTADGCEPATFFREFGEVWSYEDGFYCRTFVGDGCVCITLEGIVPVEFGRLWAEARDGAVVLRWNTRSERDLDRFELTRSANGQRDATPIGSVEATNSASGAEYQLVDVNAAPGTTYRYTLSAVEVNGGRVELATVEASPRPGSGAAEVTAYALYENFPNPFNPETQIRFDLLDAGHVSLAVYDVLGRHIATVVNGDMAKGRHAVTFDAGDLPSGLYIYRIEVNGFADQRKMLLIK